MMGLIQITDVLCNTSVKKHGLVEIPSDTQNQLTPQYDPTTCTNTNNYMPVRKPTSTRTIVQWNSMPESVIEAPLLDSFKRSLLETP